MNNPPTVVIMGTPVSSGNRGVLALGSSLAGLFKRADPNASVCFLTNNYQPTTVPLRDQSSTIQVPVVNYRMSPKSRPSQHLLVILLFAMIYRALPVSSIRRSIEKRIPFIGTVAKATIVGDVRGGDSYSDIYGFKRFAMAFLPSFAVLLVKGTMVHFPQTYGPFKGKLARWMGAYLLKRSSTVLTRDTKSLKAGRELLDNSKEIVLTPDVAFSLLPIPPETPEITPPYPTNPSLKERKVVGINVNGLMYHGGYTRNNMFGLKMNYTDFLFELCNRILQATDKDILLVPHTFAPKGDIESDNDACHILRDRLAPEMQTRVRIVASEYDQYEIKGVIGLCDFFIGSRMHSCIAALSQGVPCVGVAYSMKFLGVFESVGAGEWVVDGREFENTAAIDRTMELYEKRDSFREGLSTRAHEAKSKLYHEFSRLLANA